MVRRHSVVRLHSIMRRHSIICRHGVIPGLFVLRRRVKAAWRDGAPVIGLWDSRNVICFCRVSIGECIYVSDPDSYFLLARGLTG